MLTDLHDEMINHLTSALPGVTVDCARPALRTQRAIPLPACLLELVQVEPLPAFGNPSDFSHVALHFEARLLTDPNRADGWVEIKDLAALVWEALRKLVPQTAGAEDIRMRGAEDGSFHPGLDGYLVWVVAFEVGYWLGAIEQQAMPALRRLTLQDNLGHTEEIP